MSRRRPKCGSELVKLADLGRFLRQDPDEVRLLLEDADGIPHLKVNGRARPVFRVFLPDFHRWLLRRARECERLADYGEFLRAFWEAQRAVPEGDAGEDEE